MTQPLAELAGVAYRLTRTAFGSARFGPCEVCGKPCSETWIQSCEDVRGVRLGEQFGHEECLRAARG